MENLLQMSKKEKKNLKNQKISTVEKKQKNLIRRAEHEGENCRHTVYRNGCAVRVKGRCVEKHIRVEPLKEEERERTKLPLVLFDYVFSTAKCGHLPISDSSRRRTKSNGSCMLRMERLHTISQPMSCRLENYFEGQE